MDGVLVVVHKDMVLDNYLEEKMIIWKDSRIVS